MSEYVWNASRETSNRDRPLADRLFKAAKISLVTVTALLAAILFTVLVFLPATEIRHVRVEGNTRSTEDEILRWGALPASLHWFSVDETMLEESLLRNPRISAVSVTRKFPDTVLVNVQEREALAILYSKDASGRLKAHCVDREGVVFAALGEPEAAARLPVISGIEIRGLEYGIELGAALRPLFDSLARLKETYPALLAAVSELRLVDLKEAGLEMLLYPVHYPVPVRLRPELDADILKSILLVLDVVAARGLLDELEELDFRTETYVYRTKEAVSG